MRSFLAILVATVSVAIAAGSGSAQDETAGWLAMVTTPYGALVPVVTPAMMGTAAEAAVFGGDLELRYGRLAASGADSDGSAVSVKIEAAHAQYRNGFNANSTRSRTCE